MGKRKNTWLKVKINADLHSAVKVAADMRGKSLREFTAIVLARSPMVKKAARAMR